MGSLSKTLDVKTRDGIALAMSEADGCDDCLAAHSYVSTNLAKPPEEIALNRQGRSGDPKRQAAVQLEPRQTLLRVQVAAAAPVVARQEKAMVPVTVMVTALAPPASRLAQVQQA